MRTAYEEKRIPLQIRRLMLFSEICRKAKKHPDEIVHLAGYSKVAFSIVYSKKDKKYTNNPKTIYSKKFALNLKAFFLVLIILLQ